jgi:hypothetical protein
MAFQIASGSVVATFIIAAWPARAEDVLCAGVPKISTDPNLTLGHISSKATRVHFAKDGSTQPGCPDQTPACTDKAYLVPGDRLLLSTRRNAFRCATYVNTKREDSSVFFLRRAPQYSPACRRLFPRMPTIATKARRPTSSPANLPGRGFDANARLLSRQIAASRTSSSPTCPARGARPPCIVSM